MPSKVLAILEEILAYMEVVTKEVKEMPQSEKLQQAKESIKEALSTEGDWKDKPIQEYEKELRDARAHIKKNARWRN